MIIRDDGDSLLFITQPDHARVAADAIEHWQDDEFPANPRRDVILLAAREHDNGWLEEDASTHVDADGKPLDFVSAPVEVKHRIWPRATDRLGRTSPYAAALVAQHALAVYSGNRSDPQWNAFFETMTQIRDALLRRAQIEPGVLERDYPFVNAADRISLAFCTAWRQPLESHGRRIVLNDRQTVLVSPDPFAGARVRLRVPAKRLRQREFESSAALRRTFDEAPTELLEAMVVGTA